jgi:hypothetical protein
MLAVLDRTGFAERVFWNMPLELLESFRLGGYGWRGQGRASWRRK